MQYEMMDDQHDPDREGMQRLFDEAMDTGPAHAKTGKAGE